MANHAASLQLPIMVRQPRMVWPGLNKEGLHHKSITGDVQKRATRATTEAIRKHMEEDTYEGYLEAMSRSGTYGGQPELLAFVRTYDQDVTVHLPPSMGWDTPTLPYTNEERPNEAQVKAPLHICYGGDEDKNPHYDSSQRSGLDNHNRPFTTRPKPQSSPNNQAVQQNSTLNTRAMRNLKSDPSKDMMHELVTRGSKDLRSSFDDQRARSPSVTSSHYSTSSKRSFEDDDGQPRAKRTDRKRRSLRTRAATRQLSGSPSLAIPASTSQPTSSGPPTPTSSQDTDSSDQGERTRESTFESAASSPREVINLVDDDYDCRDASIRSQGATQPAIAFPSNSNTDKMDFSNILYGHTQVKTSSMAGAMARRKTEPLAD
ncbi:hypothetical protein OHC33_003481 [Knufia fluminis]|uniref:Uncharacterized protein n=1 Tax=Knufia fluminis TaxID=191047 RepID=A0AAN8EKD5_9EURO|nr:hypothetical protein OHC33_003481 [Knufia fluminis]